MIKKLVYLGFNNPKISPRGVERVIFHQAESAPGRHIYIYRKDSHHAEVGRCGGMICIGIPRNYIVAFVYLNLILIRIGIKGKYLIHGHNYLLTFLVLSRNVIFTVHDSLYYLSLCMNKRFKPLLYLIEIMVYCKSKRIHSVSNYSWSKAPLNKLFSYKKTVIYNTADFSIFEHSDVEAALRDDDYILIVRSIEERANLELIIKFSELLKQVNPDKMIYIVGTGPLLENYKNICDSREINNIKFLGFCSDRQLYSLYRGASCVIVPAKYGEGFGLPVIEAYYFGKPVLASDVCALPEIILDKKFLFHDEESLLNAFSLISSGDQDGIRRYFMEKFSKKQIGSLYRKMYYELM